MWFSSKCFIKTLVFFYLFFKKNVNFPGVRIMIPSPFLCEDCTLQSSMMYMLTYCLLFFFCDKLAFFENEYISRISFDPGPRVLTRENLKWLVFDSQKYPSKHQFDALDYWIKRQYQLVTAYPSKISASVNRIICSINYGRCMRPSLSQVNWSSWLVSYESDIGVNQFNQGRITGFYVPCYPTWRIHFKSCYTNA